MTDSQNNFAALPPKQKASAVISLMVAIFVIWEGIGIFRGTGKTKTAVTPAEAAIAATAPDAKKPLLKAPLPAAQQAVSVAKPTPQQSHPEFDKTPPSSIVLVQQEQSQNKYVSALNELQMLKIQKEIAETSQAIVAAKLATATAEKSITDLLSESEANPPPAGITGKAASKAATSVNIAPLLPPAEAGGEEYSVQSVTMEQDQWHAVVKYKKNLYDVSVGDQLPPDKSLVKAIDQRGVTLEIGGIEQTIPLTITDNEGGKNNSSDTAAPDKGPGT